MMSIVHILLGRLYSWFARKWSDAQINDLD